VGPFSQRTSLIVNANGFISSISNPAGETHQFSYTEDGLLTAVTDPRGNTSSYTYEADGRLIRTDDPAGGFQTLERAEFENGYEVTRKTALGRTTTYGVERLSAGDQRMVNTFPDGTQTEVVINSDGSETITLPDGTVTTVIYDPDPRWGMQAPVPQKRTITTPGGLHSVEERSREVVLTDADDPLSVETITDTRVINGLTSTRVFDANLNQIELTSPEGRQSFTYLDAQGRVVRYKASCCPYPISYTYDSLGRQSSIIEGPGNNPTIDRVYTINYGSAGYMQSISDPLGRTVNFARDSIGSITKQTNPAGFESVFDYDANGNITAITPPGKLIHSFTYTDLELMETYSPPDLGSGIDLTSYIYNLDRQLQNILRPDGTPVIFDYDNAGRLSTITIPTSTVSMAYATSTGNLMNIATTEGGSITYGYDGNLLTDVLWSGVINGSVQKTFNNNLRISSHSVNNAQTVNFLYNDDGFLIQAGGIALDRDTQRGLISGTTLGAINTVNSYNDFGERETFSANFNTTKLFDTQYSYDALGRITAKTETIDGQTDLYEYTYDLSGRLSAVKENGITRANYTYDNNGNRISRIRGSNTETGVYDEQDRLLSYGDFTYQYTVNGELLRKTDVNSGEITTYLYDAFGNLMRVVLPDGRQIDYVVDGKNRRIGKKVNGVLMQGFLYYDQLNPVAELDGSGNVLSMFVYSSKANVPDYMAKNGTTYRILSDHLGSPRIVVDVANGTVVQRMDYDEYGNVLTDTDPGFQPFGFAGGIYDKDTRLIRFGARDYDAMIGRWTTKDPILFDGGDTNLYRYSMNDPVNRADQNGLSSRCDSLQWWINDMERRLKHLYGYLDYLNAEIATQEHEGSGCSDLPDPVSRIGCFLLLKTREMDLRTKIMDTETVIKSLDNDLKQARESWFNSDCNKQESGVCEPPS
jgi:RHS repeat-associated protein